MNKEELRRECPLVAAFVDDMRKHFGPIYVRYVRENGVEIDMREKEQKWTKPSSFVTSASASA